MDWFPRRTTGSPASPSSGPRPRLPGRVPGRAEPVPGAAGRARPAARAPFLARSASGTHQPFSSPLLRPLLRGVAWLGVVLSAALVVGLPQAGPLLAPMLVWLVLWVLYLSIVNIGQSSTGFGWESLLLEAGFLAIFLGNARDRPALPGPAAVPLARVPGRARRRADQAARRPLLARPHLPGLPPRDPADAEPAQLVLPPPAEAVAPAGGGRQPRRAARRALPAVLPPADRRHRRAAHDRHAGVPGARAATSPGSTW